MPPSRTSHHVHIVPHRAWQWPSFREVWRARDVFVTLGLRDVRLRYKQTVLGVLWVILQPVLTSAIFALVFGKIAGLTSDRVPYALMAFVGMLPWILFSGTVQRASLSLVKEVNLVTKVYLPRSIIPLSSVVSAGLDFAIALALCLVAIPAYGLPLTVRCLLLPLLVVPVVLLALGVGLVTAALNVYYRDVTYALPFVLQLWFYVSPIAYSSSVLPGPWRWAFAINPLTGLVDVFRWCLLSQPAFPWSSASMAAGLSVLVFFGGWYLFEQLQDALADSI